MLMKKLIKPLVPGALIRLRRMVLIARRATYCNDGIISTHNCDFLKDPLFMESYRLGKGTGSWRDSELEWRAYVACWAAERGKSLEGDFVECGVNRGGLSRTVMHYVGLKDLPDRKFYLLDTFSGFPEELRPLVGGGVRPGQYGECYDAVVETFRDFSNVRLIRGQVPETLSQVCSERICYLSLDMNCAEPERAAAEYFWEKLVPGAVVLLDDYGFSKDWVREKAAFDDFARRKGISVLLLPTGQGIMIKP